ncbi:MAG: PocR ligand-binding domain-containing protein [Acidimicrobiales bacterium]
MTTFLTTREVQDLINVDRSTVYRMAEDGRLPGIKVGRQWRFPADRIADQLGLDAPSPTARAGEEAHTLPRPQSLHQLLPPDAAQTIANLLGDLFGTMAVVTGIDGRPLTSVANQCGLYAAIGERPKAVEASLRCWRHLAAEPELEPSFVASHLGFLCARSFIRVGSRLVGMVIVGGITPTVWPPPDHEIERVARELNMSQAALADVIEQTWDVDPDRQQWILALLPRVADLISQLASARSQLLSKLDAIATLAGPTAAHERSAP